MQYNKGFTIMEALIAIFILTISVTSMLGVTATSSSFSRFANNEITANYLLQEAIDSIRNSRDTIAFKMNEDLLDKGWDTFLNRYGWNNGSGSDKCFSSDGCYLMMEDFNPSETDPEKGKFLSGDDVKVCEGQDICRKLNYNSNLDASSYYTYQAVDNTLGISESLFDRRVKMEMATDPNEVKITAFVTWNNGNNQKVNRTQKLEMSLLNWQY